MHAVVTAFGIYAQPGKMLLKGEVGGRALNSHGNYIVGHRKSWKNLGIVFLNFCGNPDLRGHNYILLYMIISELNCISFSENHFLF